MRRLILMRHAKSDWNHPELSDHDRPLNKRGRASAKALGAWLRRKGHAPDQVLCSSSQRTGETLLGLKLDPEPQTSFVRALYHASPEGMMDVLRSAQGTCVLVLGHNPGISFFAHQLLTEHPDHIRFDDYPTGATVICDFAIQDWADVDWRQGQLVDFVIPREL